MEPTYEYVKGKGWVVVGGIVAMLGDGSRVLIEFRKPCGERYMAYQMGRYPEKPDPESLINRAQRNFSIFGFSFKSANSPCYPDYWYFTVTPYD